MPKKSVTTYPTREEKGNPFSFSVRETAPKYKPLLEPYFYDKEHSIKLFLGDSIEMLNQVPENCVDLIFADPPYFLSNGGITCHAGKMVSVNKGKWDVVTSLPKGFKAEWNNLGFRHNACHLFGRLCNAATWF
jgi:hypothetical protein